MQKLIIDTDMGDDIDDALALALAAVSPEIRIVGVTTVLGDVEKRAAQAKRVLKTFGHSEIPVFEGSKEPISNLSGLEIMEEPLLWDPSDAEGYVKEEKPGVDFIIEMIEDDPEISIVAIGPLTNLALAVKRAPEVMKNAKIYGMGGAFDSAFAEYNIACDPEAVEILLGNVAKLCFWGLEQTCKVHLDENDEIRMKREKNEGVQLLYRMIQDIHKRRGFQAYLHDLFPLYGILHPESNKFVPKKLWVEKSGERTRGTLIVDMDYFGNRAETANAEIAVVEDAAAVKETFLKRVLTS